ncbi:thaumatin-like protein isoform X1 [Ziziphus jujuba]|uniref:Thaumatin-like protein isoform X1 n=2 Tax=Ziziphus jujuba TaxID=326968 RepID=A0A6P3Z0X7_ZIZJJ|nr:thaumatin-like protein isoform X1 [Ziziphus jujuba]KAH7513983.1 hypothetical protein FEM48_Zijuj11G0040500 [Ziziphus jujuba var. spinosa]
MRLSKASLVKILCFLFVISSTKAGSIDIINRCPFVVWAAAYPGGGMRLSPGESWPLRVDGDKPGRIWARTNCVFNESGHGKCETGDCGGVLHCQNGGKSPATLAEYRLGEANKSGPAFYDISLVDGFNVPMEFSPTSPQCTRSLTCAANINDDCPTEWKVPGGCINPCVQGGCGRPANYTRFFKDRCPDAYSFGLDDRSSTFTCPGGTDYKVVFCPNDILQARIHIHNNCSYTVWAAANPEGGRQLNQGDTWTLNVISQKKGRIWGRTDCKFDGNGQNGTCESGDCDGLLQCQADGRAPYTFAEYTFRRNSTDSYSIWLVNGFNIPMEFRPTSDGCRSIQCTADINGPCPMELRDPGGCNSPCTVFRNDQFCCKQEICEPTSYSKFFKDLCPDAYSYQYDDSTSLFSCPNGNDYDITFCP